MNVPARLVLFGLSLVAVFAVAFLAGKVLIPEDTVAKWTRQADEASHGHETMADQEESGAQDRPGGLSIDQNGYRLSPVSAPAIPGRTGRLSFRILDQEGEPVVRFETRHERELHLITVRGDGSWFEHAHPHLNPDDGTWSLPWKWPAAGDYRLYADFVPAGSESGSNLTLGANLQVAGRYRPLPKPLSRTDATDGFEVNLDGDLRAGAASQVTATIRRDGKPAGDLESYLGAPGHLVALREGDLAYLHVHADTGRSRPEDSSGENRKHEVESHGHDRPPGTGIGFAVEVPTPGRYLLYLDFKVDRRVHTAEFVLEAK